MLQIAADIIGIVIAAWIVITQILIPMWNWKPLFPILRKKKAPCPNPIDQGEQE